MPINNIFFQLVCQFLCTKIVLPLDSSLINESRHCFVVCLCRLHHYEEVPVLRLEKKIKTLHLISFVKCLI